MSGAAVLAIGLAACGSSSSGGGGGGGGGSSSGGNQASAPGVTATTVTIGSHQPLTGIAAPGYSEIAPASEAYFKYINANGGINGRKIIYKFLDDQYNPTMTSAVVKKLVLQDHVFGIFNGLGTPTHEAVVDSLNQQKIPDLFVASGCLCWNNVSQHPETFGWQPDYTVEGKILGQYIAQHFKGKKIGYFYQNDDFGKNGVKGLDMEIPSSQVVARVPYEPTVTNNIKTLAGKLQAAGAQVVVSFSVPAFTALLQLNSLALGFKPQLAVSNVGSDPITLAGLLKAFAKQGGTSLPSGEPLIQNMITDTYLPGPATPSNSWYKLFKKIHDKYDAKAPLDGNVLYGMAAAYTFAQALKAAGQNPTRSSIVSAIENGHFMGPGLVPFRYSSTDHSGYTGVEMGIIKGLAIKPLGGALTTDDGSGGITPYTQPQPQAPANGIPSD
jgi:ABC-type branched-subunit amino acid transport system substrate-binding protein